MQPALRMVTVQFPRVRERVVSVFERDENFRDLCEDYRSCRETVGRLESSVASVTGVRDEYAALLLRLEQELLRYLEEHPGG